MGNDIFITKEGTAGVRMDMTLAEIAKQDVSFWEIIHRNNATLTMSDDKTIDLYFPDITPEDLFLIMVRV